MDHSKHEHKRIKSGQRPESASVQETAILFEKGRLTTTTFGHVLKIDVGSSYPKKFLGPRVRARLKERLQDTLKEL